MSRAAPRRGPHSIGAPLEYQLLWHRVTVTDGGGEVLAALAPLLASASQEIEPSRSQRYEARALAQGWALLEEGDALGVGASAQLAAEAILARSRARALELAALKGWVRLHGALVDMAGSRILLIGAPGSGKTALVLGLALRGGALQGDESVLVRDGVAVAVPAPLELAEGAVGTTVSAPAAAPAPTAHRGEGRIVLDPARDLGLDWSLRIAALDHVVVLDPRPGRVRCRPSTPAETLTEIPARLAGSWPLGAALIRELTAALRGASCHRLACGEQGAMEEAIVGLFC